MKKSSNKKPKCTNRPQVKYESAMNGIRAQYLAAGVTPQELAEIERMSSAGDRMNAALTIMLVLARLQEGE